MVSALGGTKAFTVTDSDGRFELPELPPGSYLLRAHARGYESPKAEAIDLRTGARAESSIRLSEAQPEVLAAGFGLVQDPMPLRIRGRGEEAQPEHVDDDHDERAWRIRHARRGVLRNATLPTDWFPADDGDDWFAGVDGFGATAAAPVRLAASLIADTPFSGQVNFLTSGTFQGPDQLFSGDNFSRGIAHVRVGAPAGNGDWTISGALTQADISAWIIAGSYLSRSPSRHRYDVGLSYSTQRYDGGNPLALRDLAEGSRNAGAVHAFDTVTLSPALSVTYGARYARYDYLDRRALMSPRVEVTVTPVKGFRIAGAMSRRSHAPGAEEFLPPAENGIWLPPQRTFSSIEPDQPMRAEHATHMMVSMERDIASSTIAVRAFRQEIDNQLATVFGAVLPGQPAAKVGHYLVGNVGDGEAYGCIAEFTTTFLKRVRGSVAYSMTEARLDPASNLHYLLLVAPTTVRAEGQRIHDVSTTLEADVPETATKVLVVYRTGNGFSRPSGASEPQKFDSRFDVQVRQSLPFMSFSNAKWEMLLAVRNFFRETAAHQSVYDELLVVRPPTRVVGGVTLHF